MDWRLQEAGLVAGAVLAGIPVFFGVQPFVGPGGTDLNYSTAPAFYYASWNNIAYVMLFPLLVGLALVILGIVWRGSIGRKSASLQAYASFGLGCWMLFSLVAVRIVAGSNTGAYPWGVSATVPAQNLLVIGLAVPTLGFLSSLIWLWGNGRRNPRPINTQAGNPHIGDESPKTTSTHPEASRRTRTHTYNR